MNPMEALAKFIPANPESYGFGNEVMKQTKVCSACGSIEPAGRYVCSKCRARLPEKNLFQVHQARNQLCPVCDTILKPHMEFCPHCGKKL